MPCVCIPQHLAAVDMGECDCACADLYHRLCVYRLQVIHQSGINLAVIFDISSCPLKAQKLSEAIDLREALPPFFHDSIFSQSDGMQLTCDAITIREIAQHNISHFGHFIRNAYYVAPPCWCTVRDLLTIRESHPLAFHQFIKLFLAGDFWVVVYS